MDTLNTKRETQIVKSSVVDIPWANSFNNQHKNSKQRTGENNALLYNKENNTLVVLQILCLLPEVKANKL